MAAAERPPQMHLVDANGQGLTQDVPGPGGTFRVGVGGPGYRSGVWRIWANKSAPDLHLSSREVADHHTSFHASGNWHHVFDSVERAQHVAGTEDRYLDRWTRPESDASGWTKAYSIWIPTEDVIAVGDDRQISNKIRWLPKAQPGCMTGIHIVMVRPDQGEATLTDAGPIDMFTLSNGEIVLLLASHHEIGSEERAVLDEHRATVAAQLAPMQLSPIGTAYRSTVWAVRDSTDDRALYDFAVFPTTTAN